MNETSTTSLLKDILQNGKTYLALLGLAIYAVVRVAHDIFYSQLGLTPEEVGLSQAIILARAALYFVLFVTALLVFAGLWMLLVLRRIDRACTDPPVMLDHRFIGSKLSYWLAAVFVASFPLILSILTGLPDFLTASWLRILGGGSAWVLAVMVLTALSHCHNPWTLLKQLFSVLLVPALGVFLLTPKAWSLFLENEELSWLKNQSDGVIWAIAGSALIVTVLIAWAMRSTSLRPWRAVPFALWSYLVWIASGQLREGLPDGTVREVFLSRTTFLSRRLFLLLLVVTLAQIAVNRWPRTSWQSRVAASGTSQASLAAAAAYAFAIALVLSGARGVSLAERLQSGQWVRAARYELLSVRGDPVCLASLEGKSLQETTGLQTPGPFMLLGQSDQGLILFNWMDKEDLPFGPITLPSGAATLTRARFRDELWNCSYVSLPATQER